VCVCVCVCVCQSRGDHLNYCSRRLEKLIIAPIGKFQKIPRTDIFEQ
jgi:hypothetical protein